MKLREKTISCVSIAMMGALLALAWVSSALAQVESDGDGLDGDELLLPLLLLAGVVGYIGWTVLRGRSRKSS